MRPQAGHARSEQEARRRRRESARQHQGRARERRHAETPARDPVGSAASAAPTQRAPPGVRAASAAAAALGDATFTGRHRTLAIGRRLRERLRARRGGVPEVTTCRRRGTERLLDGSVHKMGSRPTCPPGSSTSSPHRMLRTAQGRRGSARLGRGRGRLSLAQTMELYGRAAALLAAECEASSASAIGMHRALRALDEAQSPDDRGGGYSPPLTLTLTRPRPHPGS